MLLAQVDIRKEFTPANNFSSLGQLVSSFLPKILIVAGVIFFFLVVFAGVGVIAGAGSSDPHTQEKARSYLTYAITGLVIIFASYWILQLISYVTFGSLNNLIR